MSKEIADYYEEQSKKTGMTQSSLMVMALHNFMTQQRTVEMFNINDELQRLNQKIESLNSKGNPET